MKIVVSGGLGYVGGRLSAYLASNGHEVVALSRQAGNVDHIAFPANLRVADPVAILSDPSQLAGFDAFIHLAAMNEHDCVKYPEQAIEVNITGTLRWLDTAMKSGIRRFVYFSTAHVYAKPLEGTFDENTLTIPLHPYAITHKCAEDYVRAYSAEKGMSNIVIRLTNAFGGPAFPTADRWTLLVNDLCQSAVKKGKMTLLSDGLQQRDFVCMEDVCRATLHLLSIPETHTHGQIFNVGGNRSISVWDMAVQVKYIAEDYLGSSVELTRKDPTHLDASVPLSIQVDKLLSTGFVLKNSFEQEIRSTLQYFRVTGKDKYDG